MAVCPCLMCRINRQLKHETEKNDKYLAGEIARETADARKNDEYIVRALSDVENDEHLAHQIASETEDSANTAEIEADTAIDTVLLAVDDEKRNPSIYAEHKSLYAAMLAWYLIQTAHKLRSIAEQKKTLARKQSKFLKTYKYELPTFRPKTGRQLYDPTIHNHLWSPSERYFAYK
jgi:hypothetical protein